MQIRVRRVYEADDHPGVRILVDRLWPRGVSKEQARIDHWVREVAPSTALRQWFDHDPEKWDAFRQRYFAELAGVAEALDLIRNEAARGPVTLVFSARDAVRNNATALREFLLQADGDGETST